MALTKHSPIYVAIDHACGRSHGYVPTHLESSLNQGNRWFAKDSMAGAAYRLTRADWHAGTEPREIKEPSATQQALLVTLGTLGRTSGASYAQPLLPCLPGILDLVLHEPRQAVRSSALACVASLVAGLATATLPALPKLVPALLDAAEKAVKGLDLSAEDEAMADADSEDSDEVSSMPT